jgi:hypothetical protein
VAQLGGRISETQTEMREKHVALTADITHVREDVATTNTRVEVREKKTQFYHNHNI